MERRQSVFDTTKSKLSESRAAGTRTRWKYKSSHLLKKKVFISLPKYIRFDCCCFKRKQRMLKAWFRAGLTYIKWQYTHSVMLFNFSTCSKLVESTLRHPGENIHLKYWVSFQDFITEFHHHGIYSIFLIPFSKWDHLNTKC